MRAMFVMIFMAVFLSVNAVVAGVITVTDFAGKPVKGARVFYVHPVKKVYVTQDTDEGGKVTLTSAYSGAVVVFVAHTNYCAYRKEGQYPEQSLVVSLRKQEATGSIVCDNGTGYVPGLIGRLNPILDSSYRLYMYADNISLNNGVQQPAYFSLGIPLRAEDRDGNAFDLTVVDVIGRTSLIEYQRIIKGVPAAQRITFSSLPVKALGDSDFSPAATASSGLPVSYTSSNGSVAQIVDGVIRIRGVGMTIITAVQPGNEDYGSATPVAQNLWVTDMLYPQSAIVGEPFEMAIPEPYLSASSTTLAGLPPGVKYIASAGKVAGVPTLAGKYDKVTLSIKDGPTQTFTITVAPLPTWAQGKFSGRISVWNEGVREPGAVSMTVNAQGKSAGKFTLHGTNYTFSAAFYTRHEIDDSFWIETQAKSGKVAVSLEIKVYKPIILDSEVTVPQTLGVAEGWLGDDRESEAPLVMWKDVWKDSPASLVPFTGYYTAILPGNGEYGSGYLTLTVDKAGAVKIGGKLADGNSVSLAGTLVLDENGRVFTVVYAGPASYNGGCMFGLAEFADPGDGGKIYLRPFADAPMLWRSLNPQAGNAFGAGFDREVALVGGWYTKTDNLFNYYVGKNLAAGVDPDASVPQLSVGTNRYGSVYWNPTGIALTPTLKSGVMTGLSAPAAGKPVDPDKDGVWDYGAMNSVGLKISLTRATGIFKGSFNAWFDYPVKKHVSKSLKFEGALTPVRENPGDGVEGRGYFLWPDKALIPATGKSYGFNWSYDLGILMSEP